MMSLTEIWRKDDEEMVAKYGHLIQSILHSKPKEEPANMTWNKYPEQIPSDKQSILVLYITSNGFVFPDIGKYLGKDIGWSLHLEDNLYEGYVVLYWMEIPEYPEEMK